LEGLLRKLPQYIQQLKVPDYTTIFKRVRKLSVKLPEPETSEELIIAVDSTGVKVTNRGMDEAQMEGEKGLGELPPAGRFQLSACL